MTRTYRILSFLLIGIFGLTLSLEAKDSPTINNYSFGYVSFGAGYSSLCQEVPNANINGGAALLGGVGYEFRHNSFWLSVGAQYLLEQSSLTTTNIPTPYYPGKDDMGEDVQFQYLVTQTDQQRFQTIDIPLMAGYYYSGFYIGLGAKVGISYGTKFIVDGQYRLTGLYDNGVVLGNEPYDVNYYRTYSPESRTVAYSLRPQIALIGEVGYDILSTILNQKRTCHILKVGFYFECGLNSIRSSESLPPLNIDPQDSRKATINPYLVTDKTDNRRLTPFMVGAKLTYLIGGSRNTSGTWHKGCQCYGN